MTLVLHCKNNGTGAARKPPETSETANLLKQVKRLYQGRAGAGAGRRAILSETVEQEFSLKRWNRPTRSAGAKQPLE